MADENQDPSQKTEDPSAKRLEESRKKGQVVTSREVTSFFLLFALALIIGIWAPQMMHDTKILLLPFIEKPDILQADLSGLGQALRRTIFGAILISLVPLGIAFFVSIASSYLQHGHVWTAQSMIPKLNRISPIAGFKRIFSLRSVVEFTKSLIKITIVGIAIWIAVKDDIVGLRTLPDDTIQAFLWFLMKVIKEVLIAVCVCMFFIAALDYLYQRYEYMKNLRMSKQELKDEYKQQEGDPHVKARLRQIRTERAKQRMMQAVPQADVVITNPTHFAVALKYDNTAMQAPIVVAKGIDFLALNIRKIAEENDVPIVQNPPLARILYSSVEIDAEIPVAHYKAVAEVISYIYKLKGKAPKKRMGG